MATPADNVEIQVRRWLEHLREETESEFGPAARFSLRGRVELSCGRVVAQDLSSERGLIEYVLRFANGEEDATPRRRFLERNGHRAAGLSDDAWAEIVRACSRLTDTAILAARSRLRELLTAIYERRREPAASSTALRNVWPLPMLRGAPHVHLDTHWIISDVDAFNSFVAVLLLDTERPYGRDLCRCRLKECGRFFLVQKLKVGRPQRLYCEPEHMLEAHAQGSTERVQRSRAARAKAKARRSK